MKETYNWETKTWEKHPVKPVAPPDTDSSSGPGPSAARSETTVGRGRGGGARGGGVFRTAREPKQQVAGQQHSRSSTPGGHRTRGGFAARGGFGQYGGSGGYGQTDAAFVPRGGFGGRGGRGPRGGSVGRGGRGAPRRRQSLGRPAPAVPRAPAPVDEDSWFGPAVIPPPPPPPVLESSGTVESPVPGTSYATAAAKLATPKAAMAPTVPKPVFQCPAAIKTRVNLGQLRARNDASVRFPLRSTVFDWPKCLQFTQALVDSKLCSICLYKGHTPVECNFLQLPWVMWCELQGNKIVRAMFRTAWTYDEKTKEYRFKSEHTEYGPCPATTVCTASELLQERVLTKGGSKGFWL